MPPHGWPTFARSVRIESAEQFTGITGQDLGSSLLDALAPRLQTAAILGGAERLVVLLDFNDWEEFVNKGLLVSVLGRFDGYTANQKVVFVRGFDREASIHELTHSLPYLWSGSQMASECGTNYHNVDSKQVANGFQITRRGDQFRKLRDGESFAIMGPAGPSIADNDLWIAQCTYANLVRTLVNPPDPPVILVQGFIGRNGVTIPVAERPVNGAGASGALGALYQLMSAQDLTAAEGGDWAVVLRDAAGAVLGRYPFTPEWTVPVHDFTVDRDWMGFAYRVPDLAGVARLDLEGPGGLLDSREIAAAAPSVTITATGARAADGTVHVEWSGSDPGGALRYTVLYSPDGGDNWEDLAFETADTAIDVPVDPQDGAPAVKVIATNGSRSAEAVVRLTLTP